MKIHKIIYRLFFIVVFLGLLACCTKSAQAISNAKDTISTSRPSAYASLAVGVSLSDTQAIFVDNGSRWIASDSARIIGATTFDVVIASMSAANKPAAGRRTLYFNQSASGIGHSGSIIYTPVTAKHTITFTNSSAIPISGKIQILFPIGVGNTGNLPNSSAFSFNGLASNNVSISGGGATCSSWTILETSGLVQCNLGTAITGPANITISIGSTTPTLINPTKTLGAGIADTFSIQIKTLDASSVVIEEARTKIGTIDSVEVYATVDPTFTFTIAGLSNAGAVNLGNSGCSNTEVINTGFNSTATEVNLGVLGPSVINISAQLMTITTNGPSGYTLTATSSGHLIDNSQGYWIADAQGTPTNNDAPVPAFLTAGTPAFGIHPCGLDVTEGTWGTGTTGGGANAKYANPSPTFYYTLSADGTGPIWGVLGNGLTTVQYAATVNAVVPAGLYRTALTYVATPAF